MITMDFETYVNSEVPALDRAAILAGVLADADAAGIEYVVVMPNPTVHPNNQALHETIRNERRVVGCCQVNPRLPGAAADVENALTALGMRCLKIMPTLYNLDLLGPMTFALMDKARAAGAIVNIHSGGNLSHPLRIGAVARRYPDVSIIMDHMGYREWGEDAVIAAQDNPNIYLGTTIASFEPDAVIGAVKALGPERVVYGSNAPALYSDLAVQAIRRCKLGRVAEELVLGGNLARLLGMG
jgi:predicted TIM-barrel fold metal-dependent hydrolase